MSMFTLSRFTIGAMASKNDNWPSPVSSRIAWESAGEVRGPVARITLSHSRGGRPATSSPAPVRGPRAPGRHLVGVARAHDDRAQRPHLGVQQADGVAGPVVGPERVG